jgi:hypothetical protein
MSMVLDLVTPCFFAEGGFFAWGCDLRGACARKESVQCELKAPDADGSLDGGNKAHARVAINQGQRHPKWPLHAPDDFFFAPSIRRTRTSKLEPEGVCSLETSSSQPCFRQLPAVPTQRSLHDELPSMLHVKIGKQQISGYLSFSQQYK